ncbi:unnamed protein product [Mycena citricolor]|uniref:Uncharacterized protein n=1 Tax=Mycena citricolor TaxID=2018698 RepID=A0AAD2HDH2_9AGAR|nr:unnamed protein product [Mycena citricolor]
MMYAAVHREEQGLLRKIAWKHIQRATISAFSALIPGRKDNPDSRKAQHKPRTITRAHPTLKTNARGLHGRQASSRSRPCPGGQTTPPPTRRVESADRSLC